MAYSREQVRQAALEAAALELEHEHEITWQLGRDGVEFADIQYAAALIAEATLADYGEKVGGLSDIGRERLEDALMVGFTRGFLTALQLRRQ